MHVGLIFGGTGGEHEASLSGAWDLITTISQDPKYQISLYGITKEGDWLVGPGAWNELYERANAKMLPTNIQLLQEEVSHLDKKAEHFVGYPPIESFAQVDVIFQVVDGIGGEDGSLQGFLSFTRKPFVGCKILPAAQSYNKWTSKQLIEHNAISTAPGILLPEWTPMQNVIELTRRKFDTWDLIVKPNECGSSLGVTKINTEHELLPAVSEARKYCNTVLVEKHIDHIELLIGVFGTTPNITVGEPMVTTSNKKNPITYYDKYVSGEYELEYFHSRTNDSDTVIRAQKIAKRVYEILGCCGYARVDLFYVKDTNELIFNEVNTTPAITTDSSFARSMNGVGIPYEKLIDTLLQTSVSLDATA